MKKQKKENKTKQTKNKKQIKIRLNFETWYVIKIQGDSQFYTKTSWMLINRLLKEAFFY